MPIGAMNVPYSHVGARAGYGYVDGVRVRLATWKDVYGEWDGFLDTEHPEMVSPTEWEDAHPGTAPTVDAMRSIVTAATDAMWDAAMADPSDHVPEPDWL